MKNKSQSPSILLQFIALDKTQFQANIQIICTDNAKEFCKGEALNVYNTHGIEHQTSCVYTP